MNKKRKLKKIEKQKRQLIQKKPWTFGIQETVREKIPDKALSGLESAFAKSFSLIFKKGNGWIEKVSHIDDAKALGEFLSKEFSEKEDKKTWKQYEKVANASSRKHLALTQVKSSAMGLFGIGIPDIPIYIATLLSSIYQVGAVYGFDIQTERERQYVLMLLCAVCDEPENREEWMKKLEHYEQYLATDLTTEYLIQRAAHALSYSELQAKFLQGIPIVGVAGALMSSNLQAKIVSFAKKCYQRRRLLKVG